MKQLIAAAMLIFPAPASGAASAQVYGGEDDPYQQNPFASNMTVPEPSPPADSNSAPAGAAQTQAQTQTGAGTPPAAPSSNGQDAKPQSQP